MYRALLVFVQSIFGMMIRWDDDLRTSHTRRGMGLAYMAMSSDDRVVWWERKRLERGTMTQGG